MPEPLDHQVLEVTLRLCEGLATPLSLKVAILCRYQEWDQLAEMRVDPKHYLDAEQYWLDCQAANFLRKCADLPTTVDRKAAAEEVFVSCERQCFRTNQSLLRYLYPLARDEDTPMESFFRRARKICSQILGRAPLSFPGKHGPGATFGDRGGLTTVPDKMSSSPTLTPGAFGFLFDWAETAWSRAVLSGGKTPLFTKGNRFTTVPKDATKDRGIAIEPSLNVFYQLGVGGAIRQRLARFGIDLKHGQDIHRRVACEASIRGHLATMDLSNASDTVCRNLVKLLLPPDWYEILSDLRSPRTLFKGKWVLLEKFSSMGNGFTFELETLVFLCLILAIPGYNPEVGKELLVYGDDIIIPIEMSKVVRSVLEFCGFTPNMRKTFSDGCFRESCGGDYFLGVDVRPHFLESSPREPQHLIALANGLRRRSQTTALRSARVRRAWFSVLDSLPISVRNCRGPQDLGDLVVHDEERLWQYRWRDGIRYFRCFRPARFRKVAWSNWKPDVVLAAALYGIGSGGEISHIRTLDRVAKETWDHAGVIPRGAVEGYAIAWVPFS